MIPAVRRILHSSAPERERVAEAVADRLDKPLTVAGVIFALVVLADTTVDMDPAVRAWFDAVGWGLWAVFVGDFLLRLFIAPSATRFLRRNWWQVIFLAVPFLRFMRPLARLRVPQVGRVVSSAVRTSRAATRSLSARVTWLAVVTVIVILSASQVVFVFGDYGTYAEALHDAALAAITGEPFRQDAGVVQVLEVVLALYSVVVFASLAGALGAFFLERRVARDGDQAVGSSARR